MPNGSLSSATTPLCPFSILSFISHQKEQYKPREKIISNPRIILLKDCTFWSTVFSRMFSRNSCFYLRIEERCKATSQYQNFNFNIPNTRLTKYKLLKPKRMVWLREILHEHERKEAYNIVFKNLTSFIDRELNFNAANAYY